MYIYIYMYVYVCVYIYIHYICTYVSLDQEIDPGPGCWGCASFKLLGFFQLINPKYHESPVNYEG